MTNLELLRTVIDDSGYKMRFIAEFIGLSYQGFLNKIKGLSNFDNEEIIKFCKLLHISKEMMMKIFFANWVDEM